MEGTPLKEIRPVVTALEVAEAREVVRKVQVHDGVLAFAVGIAEATRTHPAVSLGVSPRRTVALVRAAQARAATKGRDFVGPEDVKELAPDALPHRISVRGGSSGETAEAVVSEAPKSLSKKRLLELAADPSTPRAASLRKQAWLGIASQSWTLPSKQPCGALRGFPQPSQGLAQKISWLEFRPSDPRRGRRHHRF